MGCCWISDECSAEIKMKMLKRLRLLPSVCEKIIIQQTLIRLCPLSLLIILICFSAKLYWEVRQTAAEVGEKVDFVKNSSTFNL